MPLGANKAAIMGVAGVSGENIVLLADNSSDTTNLTSIEFDSLITSKYKEYLFRFYNINTIGGGVNWHFQGSIDGGSNYNVAMTTTFIKAYHHENDTAADLVYASGNDQAQGTSYQDMIQSAGTQSDASIAGELHLFNPASTTYVKHFYGRMSGMQDSPTIVDEYFAGYLNTTSAINAINFKFSSGNVNGLVKMWGVK